MEKEVIKMILSVFVAFIIASPSVFLGIKWQLSGIIFLVSISSFQMITLLGKILILLGEIKEMMK